MKASLNITVILLLTSATLWGYGTSKSSSANHTKKHTTPAVHVTPAPDKPQSHQDNIPEAETIQSTQQSELSDSVLTQQYIPESQPSFLDEIAFRGTLGLSYNSYSTDENPDNFALEGNSDITKKWDDSLLSGNLALLYDVNDKNRRYVLLNELYYKTKNDDTTFVVGRNIRNWGVMEAYSITDVFNTKNYLSDSFDMSSKYGAANAEFTYSHDKHQFSIIAKAEEIQQPYPKDNNIFNYLPLPYDGILKTEKNPNRPTLYLKYSGTYSGNTQADYSLILQNGYDSKRYFDYGINNTSLEQHAYLVNKALFYGSLAYENTIYKCEGAYAQVISDPLMSDYYQASAGIEYLPSESINGAELRLLLEYYHYTYADKSKLKNQDFAEIFDNDIFTGLQSSFGDAGSSEIKGGVLYDLHNKEQTYILNFGTRMKENYRLSMEWMVAVPGNEAQTAIKQMGQFNQVTFRANYFF
jgi:hypothetical protein